MVSWGIVSTARINRQLLRGLELAHGAEAVAVASRDLARAQGYAAEHGIPRAHGSYEALLADPEVDVVYISLPNSLHVEWTLRALEAGKHVLCEKPLSRRPTEVERVFDEAERRGRLVMEAFMYRHHPQIQRTAQLVADGAIGALRLVRGAFSFATTGESDIRLLSGLDGGALMDVGCYCVDAARMLAGEPIRVTGEQRLGGDGVDVVFAGTMRFSDGVIAEFDTGLDLPVREELEVVGNRGSLYLADPWHALKPVIEWRREEGVERIELPAENPYTLEVENLSAAITGAAAPLLGRADAVGQARTIHALYASADAGQAVSLDP